MKRMLAIVLSVLLMLTAIPLGAVSVVAAGDFAGGSGTETDPYLVATKAHLNNVRKDLSAHYKMIADIEFTEADYQPGGGFYNDSNGWEPIGTSAAPFTGTFDGGYYDIVGLKMDRTAANVGLFGYLQDGTICNVRLRNADMKGGNYTGAICGYAKATSGSNVAIRQCYVDGSVEGNKYVGGICGYATANISECYNKATVTAVAEYVGGIVSYLNTTTSSTRMVSSCVNEGAVTVSGSSAYAGGIVGYLDRYYYSGNYSGSYRYASVENSFNKGTVTGYRASGIANGYSSSCGISYCYNIGSVTYDITGGCSQTSCYSLAVDGETVLSDKRTFMDWNFETIWTMAGSEEYAYPELQGYMLRGDIVVDGTVAAGNTLTAVFVTEYQQPDVLTYGWYADGVLVGQGDTYTVTAADVDKELMVRATSVDHLCAGSVTAVCGDFSADFAGGSGTEEDPYLVSNKWHLNNVRNDLSAHYKMTADIVFTDVDFALGGAFYNNSNGWEPIGPFTGMFDGGNFNIYNLQMDRTAADVGLFGYLQDGTICNVRLRNADMKGGNYTGAICGYATTTSGSNVAIRQCYVDGSVEGNKYVGGICGYATANISECYNKATVTAASEYVGGIVSYLNTTTSSTRMVSSCVNEGAVTVSGSSAYAGGIVGYLDRYYYSGNYSGSYRYASVENSFNKGTVTGYRASGIANGYSSNCGISYCYNIGSVTYEITGSCSQTSCYSLALNGETALSDKRTFMDWNFETIWTMAGDMNYPYPELLCFTNASVNVNGTVAYGETVNAYYLTSGAQPDTIVYEWFADGILVGSGESYTITAADVGKYLTVRATTTDAFGTSTVNSTLYLVEKAVQTATPVNPQVLHVTDNSFILSTEPGHEYSVDGETWQASGTFADLLPNHAYVVYVRMAESAVYNAGETVEAVTVITSLRPIVGSVAIEGEGVYGETLRADVSGITTPDATIQYEWVCGTTVLGTGATYTIIKEDIGQSIVLRVSGTGDYTGALTSAAVTGKKAENTRVATVPVVLETTGDTVTVLAVPGCEYSIDGVNWQSGNVFTDLQAVHVYTVYQRYAATETHNAGPCSEGARATTTKETVEAPAAPQMQSNSGTSITLVPVYGCEYSKDGTNWQDSPIFRDLKPCTTYTFYQRYKETDTAYAGPASAAASFSTLSTHVYDTVCDPICNICGAVREIDGHVYDNACDEQCNICGMYRGVEDHVYDNACDATCNECGATRTVGAHVYGNACDADCDICGVTRTPADHVYTNACDADCNVCGAARIPADHVYANACDTSCDVCGAVRTVGDHVYDNACDRVCNVCDGIRAVEGHVYTSADTVSADCGNAGVRTYTCSNCGDSYTETIAATGAHVYENGCDATCNVCGTSRAVSHAYVGRVTAEATCGADGCLTYTCSNCGDSYTEAIYPSGAHSFSDGCDGVCDVCGASRNVEHAYVGTVITEATCTTDGVVTYTCSNCGDSYDVVISASGIHTYEHGCDADCAVCGFVRPVDGHIYDNAYDADCNTCGAVREAEEIPETAPTFAVDNAIVYPGKTFTVAIRTQNNSGIVSFKLSVGYDASVLELVSVQEMDFADLSYSSLALNPFIINWVDAINPDNATNGVVALVTFRVKETAAVGTTDITLSYNPEDVYDSAFGNVVFRVETGTVQILDFLPGDVNRDGNVNNKDLGLLQQVINEWDINYDSNAADTNGDGSINNKDLGLLQRYLNAWDVTLG